MPASASPHHVVPQAGLKKPASSPAIHPLFVFWLTQQNKIITGGLELAQPTRATALRRQAQGTRPLVAMTELTPEQEAAALRAEEQARLRKARREAKIKAGAAHRLNTITGLASGIPRG